MENRSEFNLTQSLNSWKKTLAQSGTLTNDNILELESHLLDEFETLQLQDLNEEECFLIAKKRIGQLNTLKSEYGKVNQGFSFAKKIEPYFKGILIYLSVASLSKIYLFSIYLFDVNFGLGWSRNSILIGALLAIVAIVIVVTKSSKGIRIIKRMNTIPFLFTFALISKISGFAMDVNLTQYVGMKMYAMIATNVVFFQLITFALILIGSLILKYLTHKSKQLILQE